MAALRTAMAKNIKQMMPMLKNGNTIRRTTTTKSSSTTATPKASAYTTAIAEEGSSKAATTKRRRTSLKEELLPKGKSPGDYVPVYVALGMITLSLSLGLYTAKQELLHGPDVRVKKTRRETLPEVVEPENVVHEAEDFVKKSLFRKLAHIQEFETPIPNPIRGDRLSKEPKVESLKTVGVDPVQVPSSSRR